MKRRFASALAATVIALTCTAAVAADRSEVYRQRFAYMGAYVRAYGVCDNKAMLYYGLDFIDAPEFKAFGNAYPKTMQAWGLEGTKVFNTMVLKEGIPAACKRMTDMMNGSAR